MLGLQMGPRSEKKIRAPRSVRGGTAEAPAPSPSRPQQTPISFPGMSSAKIHGAGRLDFVLDFVKFVAKPMPLSLLLDEAPRRIADIVGADVSSLYLLEGEGDELVLRGNVGFPQRARGTVRLPVGEGITGMA